MAKVLEFIVLNYPWFLGGMIIIILAIIGSYADKTNFGQGEKNQNSSNNNEDKIDLKNKRMNDFIQAKNTNSNDANDSIDNNHTNIIDYDGQSNLGSTVSINDSNNNEIVFDIPKPELENAETNEKQRSFEESYDKLEQQFNTVLPKKELIDDDLLEDIENLSLDKTQKFDPNQIPDLDDVELPDINHLGIEDKDIWKF